MHDLASIRTGERPYHNITNIIYISRGLLSVTIDAHDSYRWPFSYHVECLVYEHFARS